MKKKSSSRFAGAGALIALVLFVAAGCLVASGTLAASFRPDASEKISKRTLTFGERVAYQYAIEEVYWHHRIWPNDNPGPKPSLDAVVSQREIEKKVEDHLHKSQLVADQRGWPITASELQAEMDRMASRSKQPEVLREFFEALGNDPFVIAECLARPIVAERILAGREGGSSAPISQSGSDLDGKSNHEVIKNTWPWALATIARGAADLPDAAYILPEISDSCADNSWTTTAIQGVGRYRHTTIWTGTEMIVWGGEISVNVFSNTGERYNPSTDSWAATSTINVPTARADLTAVWTGTEMIVWGGDTPGVWFNTGGRYSPTTDTWTATSTVNAPAARELHTAVWTGSEMIVWGGYYQEPPSTDHFLNTGGRYSPSADTWVATSTINAPDGRDTHTAVWTGTGMIVWGGAIANSQWVNTGGSYNVATNSWSATSIDNAPAARAYHTAVWTGNEMIVWGGFTFSSETNTGGRYNPSADGWIATSITNAPTRRYDHTTVWTGSDAIVWGGDGCLDPACTNRGYPNTGARYSPTTDAWVATNLTNAPLGREGASAVWTGGEMIVWGGFFFDGQFHYLNTGGRYCAQPSTPVVQSAFSRKTHGDAGSFDINLPLSGTAGIECRSGGATNDYTIVLSFLANVSVNGNPQAAVTSGIGSIGSGGVSNGGTVTIAGNIVTIPLTNVPDVQTINVTLNNVNGPTNVTIPMSILVGDVNGNGAVNASDVAITKSRLGQPINPTTFRSDVNVDGSINATDVSLVKSKVGTGLP